MQVELRASEEFLPKKAGTDGEDGEKKTGLSQEIALENEKEPGQGTARFFQVNPDSVIINSLSLINKNETVVCSFEEF